MQATTTLYFQFHFLPAIYFHLYLYVTFKTGEAPPEASLPVYTKSLNRSVLYTPFSSIFLKLSFTAATSS